MERSIRFTPREKEIKLAGLLLFNFREVMSKNQDTISFNCGPGKPKVHIIVPDLRVTLNTGEDYRNKTNEEVILKIHNDLKEALDWHKYYIECLKKEQLHTEYLKGQ